MPLVGGRTRAALEREKTLALRAIKELEFDHAMGKVSDQDFAEMGARLRARAAGLMRQLDAGASYSRRRSSAKLTRRARSRRRGRAAGRRAAARPLLRAVRRRARPATPGSARSAGISLVPA